MKKLLFFILVIYCFSSKSQTSFIGIVTEQNSGYKAIPNVKIKSEASNTISSDVKGNFNLSFQNKKEGDEIYLQAEKAGYEIVNAKEMATKIPKKQTNPFRIVMCKAGMLAQNRAKYYEISEKHIIQKYETELTKLNRSTEDWREKAAKLEENFRSSLEFAKELADKYSMMNLDDVSELQRKAFRLYEEDRVDEALKILEGEHYQENIKQVKVEQKKIQDNTQLADNEIAKSEEIIQQQISKLMFQADLYAQDFQFDKAEKTYEIAVKADSLNYTNTFYFTNFLEKQKNILKAEKILGALLSVPHSDNINSIIFSQLGIIYSKSDNDKSLFYFNEELKYYDTLTIYTDNSLSRCYNNIALTYKNLNNSGLALFYIEKAIKEYKFIDLKYEISIQSNYALILQDLKRYDEALKILIKWEATFNVYFEKNNENLFTLSIILLNIGNLYSKIENINKAIEYQTKSKNILEQLSILNPNAYDVYLANSKRFLGKNIYIKTKNKEVALDELNGALLIFEGYYESNNIKFSTDFTDILSSIIFIEESENNFPEAIIYNQKLYNIYKKKIDKGSNEIYLELEANQHLAILFGRNNSYEDSWSTYETTVEQTKSNKVDKKIIDLLFSNFKEMINFYIAENDFHRFTSVHKSYLSINKLLVKSLIYSESYNQINQKTDSLELLITASHLKISMDKLLHPENDSTLIEFISTNLIFIDKLQVFSFLKQDLDFKSTFFYILFLHRYIEIEYLFATQKFESLETKLSLYSSPNYNSSSSKYSDYFFLKQAILKLYQNKPNESILLFQKYNKAQIENFDVSKILTNDLIEFSKYNPTISINKFKELLEIKNKK